MLKLKLIHVSRRGQLCVFCRYRIKVHSGNYTQSSCFVVFCWFYPYPSGLLHWLFDTWWSISQELCTLLNLCGGLLWFGAGQFYPYPSGLFHSLLDTWWSISQGLCIQFTMCCCVLFWQCQICLCLSGLLDWHWGRLPQCQWNNPEGKYMMGINKITYNQNKTCHVQQHCVHILYDIQYKYM